MDNENYTEIIRPLAVGVIVLAILFALSFCFLRAKRGRDAGVGERINTATKIVTESRGEQSAITGGITDAKGEAEAVRESISKSHEQAVRVDGEVRATGEAISECRASIERCQQLIARVKARASANGGQTP